MRSDSPALFRGHRHTHRSAMTGLPRLQILSPPLGLSPFFSPHIPHPRHTHLRLLTTPGTSPPRKPSLVYLAPDVKQTRHPDDAPPHAAPPRPYRRGRARFVDRVRVLASGGAGGAGAATFTRGPNAETAPPDGGSGGAGGSVWLRADDGVTGLEMWRRHVRGGDGAKGAGALRRGKAGADAVVRVPPGTLVRREGGMLVCDLDVHGAEALVARGGHGGRGNAVFKSSTNRSPDYAQPGGKGAEVLLELELKTIADVGLVGFPNAGKSTLLRAVSHAKPKVASYPFTTIRPHIGVVEELGVEGWTRDARRFSIADIPGLIAGAHENRGLGHEFLRHVERTAALVYVVDVSGGRDGKRDLDVLMRELELYEPGLSKRPSCVAANKMDAGMDAVDGLRALVRDVGDSLPVFPISARDKTGTDELVAYLFQLLRPAGAAIEKNVEDASAVTG